MNLNFTRSIPCLLLSLLLSSQLFAQKYEAENAVLAGGAKEIACTSCSGEAAVAQEEGNLTFTVNLPETGFYTLYIQASAPGDKINIISIDGTSGDFSVEESNSYHAVKAISSYKLSSGQHQVEIQKSWGWINIDYIEFELVDASERFNLEQELVTPDPIPEASALYQFFLDHYNKRIISGGMTLNDIENSDWLDWIEEETGEEVALLGIDFMHSVGKGTGWINDTLPVWDAKTWYERNGIPAIMWHWRDPSKETEAFYTDDTDFDISKISDETSAEYQAMLEDIDKVAGLIKILDEQNIPIVWRPLHEAAGGWFWWGAKGPEPLKALWQLTFDRMVNHHGLRNIIWVWTSEPGDDAWYPGDEYVDIIGRDIYRDGYHGSHVLEFNSLNARYGGRKMIALSEHGSLPDPENLLEDEAGWLWFMPWYGDYTTSSQYNSADLWDKVMNHDYVITLSEMPELKTYTRQEVSEPERPAEPETEPKPTAIWNRAEGLHSFTAYPTLVDDFLIIKGDRKIRSVTVYNLIGIVVNQLSGNQHEIKVPFDQVLPGIYLLRVNGSESLKVWKK